MEKPYTRGHKLFHSIVECPRRPVWRLRVGWGRNDSIVDTHFVLEQQVALELGSGNGDTVFEHKATRGKFYFIHILPQ